MACGRVQDTLMIWDTEAKAYTEGASMATGRSDACGAAVDGKLYVIGGYTTNFEETLSSVEVFDPASGEWAEGPPLPEPRCAGSSAVVCLWCYRTGAKY